MKLTDLTTKPGNPEAAQTKIDNLQEEKSKLQNKISELNGEISELQEEASNVALQDSLEGTSGSGNVQRKLRNKQNEKDAKLQALKKIEEHLKMAEKDKILAEAKVKRKEAQKLDDEAEGIEKQAEKHLNELEKIQGCKYVPFIQTWRGSPMETIDRNITKDYVSPQSEILRRQANKLKNQAAELEKKAEKQEQSAKQEKQPVS